VQRCGSQRKVQLLTQKPATDTSYVTMVAAGEVALCRDDEPPGTPGRYTRLLLPSLRRFTFTLPARFQGCAPVEAGTNRLYVLRQDGVWTGEFPAFAQSPPMR